jgi:hypothetical protein
VVRDEKVVPNRTENVNQHARLATNGTVIEMGFNVETVAWAKSRFDAVDEDIKFATHNVAYLRVRVRMNCANRTGFELDSGHQDGIVVAKQLPNQPFADQFPGFLVTQHERLALPVHKPPPLLWIGSLQPLQLHKRPQLDDRILNWTGQFINQYAQSEQ